MNVINFYSRQPHDQAKNDELLLSIDQLFKKGSITGPYKKTTPVQVRHLWLDLRDLAHDLAYVFQQARGAWKFTRYMRRGGNPDELPF